MDRRKFTIFKLQPTGTLKNSDFEALSSSWEKMRPPLSLSQALSSLSLHPRPRPQGLRTFSTTPTALSGPIVRLRRDRIATKLKRSKARAADIVSDREARANPIITRHTKFTSSLLNPHEILAQPGNAPHSRTDETNWPALTNFGLSAVDSASLAFGAKGTEIEAIEKEGQDREKRSAGTSNAGFWIDSKVWRGDLTGNETETKINEVRRRDELKWEVMSRIVDMTNACSKDIAAVNIQSAVRYFARNQRDTGSPEVQSMTLSFRRGLNYSWGHDGEDSCIERSFEGSSA
jgi:hypothetical protein